MKPANGKGIPRLHGSQALVPAHLGAESPVRGGGGSRCPHPGGSQRRGGAGRPGDKRRLTCLGAHPVAGWEVVAAAYPTFLGPPSHAPP